jgi:predicted  nucleic acid-binding Zn-ribbon protein
MNCAVEDDLVNQLIILNNKLNTLSPDLVHGDDERAEVQQQREVLRTAIKRHRAKGHEGRPCPAARQSSSTIGIFRAPNTL